MNTYIKLIIVGALLLGASSIQADHHGNHSKTNKVHSAKNKPATKKKVDPKVAEARKKYVEAAKKIKEAVKAGKLTEKQAKAKYAELRKKMAPNRASSKAATLKRFDKNKDGKLNDNEKAAMRKAMAERRKKSGDRKRGKSRRPRKNK